MNTAVLPEIRRQTMDDDQVSLATPTENDQRYLWRSKFGSILIEVMGNRIFVNGQLVEPAIP